MSQRITVITIVEINGDEAIQLRQDNLTESPILASKHHIDEGIEARYIDRIVLDYLETGHINTSSINKEIIRRNATAVSTVSHQELFVENSIIPAKKEIVGNSDEKVSEPGSDYQLAQLIKAILIKLVQLLDLSVQEAVKEITKKLVNAAFYLTGLLIFALLFSAFHC